MAELKNTFSWSFSAAQDFEECRRRRYWSKYGMWGGWSKDASPAQRAAYRLNKMENRYSLMGQAVERSVLWVLRERQRGAEAAAEAAFQNVARPYLNGCWKESKSRQWMEKPKQVCCLHEHYYPHLQRLPPEKWIEPLSETVKQCIGHFIAHTLPRLAHIRPEQEVAVARVEDGGDPESFELEGVKIYAIPDYVYVDKDLLHIHDWKAGKSKDAHREQVGLYALWARAKQGFEAGRVRLFLEYLQPGTFEAVEVTAESLEAVKSRIGHSVGEMTEYLEDGDRQRNRPVPREEWELDPTREACVRCNFYELCEPEFENG